jgi:hypothetical protein
VNPAAGEGPKPRDSEVHQCSRPKDDQHESPQSLAHGKTIDLDLKAAMQTAILATNQS